MPNNFNIKNIIFFAGLFATFFIWSCRGGPVTLKSKGMAFEGVYFLSIPNSKLKIKSYSVEFNRDKTARVFILKKGNKTPKIIRGRYMFSKENKNIVILYFENIPPEFFLKDDNGSLLILDKNKKPHREELRDFLKLEKIKDY